MTMFDYNGFLKTCGSLESDCFMFDPGALEAMLFNGDKFDRSNFQAIATAAVEAGQNGIPLEEATYHPSVVSEASENIFETAPYTVAIIGDGEGAPDLRTQRIARCAYVCGKFAVDCPVLNLPEANPCEA